MTVRKILVIDDEPHIRHVISRKLQSAGYEVHTASDGASGLQLLNSVKPALIITDYRMPDMTGLQVCGACRENPQTCALPILLVTGSIAVSNTVQSEVDDLDNVVCISKPFSPRELLRTVDKFLKAGDNAEADDEA